MRHNCAIIKIARSGGFAKMFFYGAMCAKARPAFGLAIGVLEGWSDGLGNGPGQQFQLAVFRLKIAGEVVPVPQHNALGALAIDL